MFSSKPATQSGHTVVFYGVPWEWGMGNGEWVLSEIFALVWKGTRLGRRNWSVCLEGKGRRGLEVALQVLSATR